MKELDLKKRTRILAHQCVALTNEISNSYINRHYKSQLIRCSTSMAANYQAACVSQSITAFIAKLSIAIEEADEILFWLTFMLEEQIFTSLQVKDIIIESQAIISILCKSRITARKNLADKKLKS